MLPLISREVPNGSRSMCKRALDQEELYMGKAVGCMTASTVFETAAPGDRDRHLGQGVLCRWKADFSLGGSGGRRDVSKKRKADEVASTQRLRVGWTYGIAL